MHEHKAKTEIENRMRWNPVALASLVAAVAPARNVSAFAPAASARAFAPRANFSRSSAAMRMAKVNRLTDPSAQLLDHVDVFIFDCDGVIWRVSVLFFFQMNYKRNKAQSSSEIYYTLIINI